MTNEYLKTKCERCGYYGGAHTEECNESTRTPCYIINFAKITRKIRECEGEAAAQLILETVTKEARRQARLEMWHAINAHIKTGDLGGNGCDMNAQRNGLVLAANLIFQAGI
jgi:hypothetical protein